MGYRYNDTNVNWFHNDDWSLWEAFFTNPHDLTQSKQIAAIERTTDNRMVYHADGSVAESIPFTEWLVIYGPMMQKLERFPTLAQAKIWVEARRYPLLDGKV